MRQKKNVRGQFAKKPSGKRKSRYVNVHVEHNYCVGSVCDQEECKNTDCRDNSHLILGKNVDREGWKMGRRLVEFKVLLQELSVCKGCRLGPVPLTLYNVVGEMKKGLGGYLYVVCQNAECGHINCVPYGKTYHEKKCGMPCFAANTKLGTAMIDSVGGPVRVNNLLSTLNIKPISNKNLKCMERRAGSKIKTVASKSTRQAAADAFQMEMEDVRHNESFESEKNMDGFIDDIGVCPLPDTSPGFKSRILSKSTIENDDEWTDDEHDNGPDTVESSLPSSSSGNCDLTPRNARYLTACAPLKKKISDRPFATARRKIRLSPKYPCKTRSGMSCAVDTAWQKRGFDSLTSHTFFMSKAKYGKKVVKTIVSHRSCGTCQWWRRNRPGQPIRKHRCVHNHSGSARLMESVSGERGVTELIAEGTPVEYLEGDGDNTLIARLKSNLNLNMKKRFDRNHIVKNIGKSLYSLRAEKGIKLSKILINHVQKCLKYAFAKHQGDKVGLEENLRAIIPHQFGDHSLCLPRFCGYKRKPGDVYRHKSLPYKGPLKDDQLRLRLEKIFQPITANDEKYSDLGSSQQCEHANREVTLRAPKSLHYGNSESLDFRVHATSAFIKLYQNL